MGKSMIIISLAEEHCHNYWKRKSPNKYLINKNVKMKKLFQQERKERYI
jgi:hypothetical protein